MPGFSWRIKSTVASTSRARVDSKKGKLTDVNKAVKNNPQKFPEGHILELLPDEKTQPVENFHRFNRLVPSQI